MLETELNMVALKESEQPGCHHLFIIIDNRVEPSSKSDPEILAIASSKERGIFDKVHISASSNKHGDLHQQ